MKKNNGLAYLVGFLFGLLFSIPWLAFYAFLNLSVGYFAILIVIGIILGYKIVAKEMYNNRNNRLFLILSSLLIVTINVVVLMPLIKIFVSQGKLSLETIKLLYTTKSMITAFAVDLILAAVMVLVPAILLPVDFKKNENEPAEGKDFISKVQSIFENHGAISKETAVDKKIIKEEVKNIEMGGIKKFFFFDLLKGLRIKSTKGKWFFIKSDKSFKYGVFLSVIILIAVAAGWNIGYGIIGEDLQKDITNNVSKEVKEKTKNIEYKIGDKITITMPDCMTYAEDKFDDSNGFDMYYYQYISKNVARSDLQSIQIFYYNNYNIHNFVSDYDAFVKQMDTYMSQYNILKKEQLSINDNHSFYYIVDKLDNTRISVVYFTVFDNELLEVYMHLTRDNFDSDKALALTNPIFKSIKINRQ